MQFVFVLAMVFLGGGLMELVGNGLWFYRGEDMAPFHYVAVPAGASALVWVDEQANCFFLLTGGETQSELLSMAESVYRSERSE